MATTTITTPTLPDQQLPQQVVPNPIVAANSNSSWHSSGSIGPFFAVISVLAVLAIISCVLGRICTAQGVTPLESVKHRGWFGWLKGRCRWCMGGGDVEVGVKMDKTSNDAKAQDGV
ncbi:hypothetical protein CsSME_00053908 [Camellia sinensis var. sinensis]